jgi:hypothetical protein
VIRNRRDGGLGRRPLLTTLHPGQRVYPASQSPFATVDRYGLLQDLYVILGGVRPGRRAVATVS